MRQYTSSASVYLIVLLVKHTHTHKSAANQKLLGEKRYKSGIIRSESYCHTVLTLSAWIVERLTVWTSYLNGRLVKNSASILINFKSIPVHFFSRATLRANAYNLVTQHIVRTLDTKTNKDKQTNKQANKKAIMTSFQGLKGLFGSKKSNDRHNDRHIAEIGMPTNVVHDIHVGKNAHGELEGTCKITTHQIRRAYHFVNY